MSLLTSNQSPGTGAGKIAGCEIPSRFSFANHTNRPAQHTVPLERVGSALRFRLATPPQVLRLRRKMFQTRVGFGSRCYELCRPKTDVYSQSFEQRERFASPSNTQNSSGSTTTELQAIRGSKASQPETRNTNDEKEMNRDRAGRWSAQ